VSRTTSQSSFIADQESSLVDTLPGKADIARYCGVTRRTVDRWIAERKLPYLKFGYRTVRFRWSDVNRALDRLQVKEVS
jgi:excisionase family DNA binding protein